ncbi:MAG: hypothetical protein RR553_05250 [Akkermansia sp.]
MMLILVLLVSISSFSFSAEGYVISIGFALLMLIGSIFYAGVKFASAWKVWLDGLCGAGLFLWLSLPIVWIWFPDAYYESSFLSFFMLEVLVTLICWGGFYVVVPVLWPERRDNPLPVGVNDVDPAQGKTVTELRGGVALPPHTFLFGSADHELVSYWRTLGQTMINLSKKQKSRVLKLVAVFLLYPLVFYFVSGGGDASFQRDIAMMWETEHDSAGKVVASKVAINAAKRVFENDVALRGLTRSEAMKLLHFDRMNPQYKLNKPRYTWQGDRMLLRISDGKVSAVLQVGYDDSGRILLSWLESDV